MKTVRVYDSPQMAYIAAGMLRDNGIPAEVINQTNLYVPVFEGVEVVVRDQDALRAMELLKESDD